MLILGGMALIGIYVNKSKNNSAEISNKLQEGLIKRNLECEILSREFSSSPELIVVIGGDGTVLEVVERASKMQVPVLAINAGCVGFLAGYEDKELEECIDFIANGKFEIEERPLIKCQSKDFEGLALNEVSVQRRWDKGDNGCTLSLSLKIDGEFVDSFRADGIIVATPTGSTAYSLSAGGAILTPKINALIATPLCAHTLRSKPIVFSDSVCSEIQIDSDYAGVHCDGKFVGELKNGEKITVVKSSLILKLIKGKKSFYQTLFKKLNSWSEK